MFDKGKQKAEGSIFNLPGNQSEALSPISSLPNRPATGDHPSNRLYTSNFPLNLSPSVPSSSRKSTHESHLELPLQWAKRFISLDLPRIQAHGPILFIKLSNSPTQGFNPISNRFDQIIGSDLPAALRPKSRGSDGPDDESSRSNGDGWWYLIIATKQLIFVMESQPNPQRKWHLRAEMSAPFTAKTANLVLAEFPKTNHVRTSSQSRHSSISRRAHNPRIGLGELAVLITMKEYAVVVSLSDLSVRELDLQGALVATQTTGCISPHVSTPRSVSGSFSGLSHLERVQTNFMPFARNMSLINGSMEPILTTNKRIKDGFGKSRDDGFQIENRRSSRLVGERRWVGCEELLIPVPSRQPVRPNRHLSENPGSNVAKEVVNLRAIYLVTRGYLTCAVICPFGFQSHSRSNRAENSHVSNDQAGSIIPGGPPPPLSLKPFHTFTWKAIPVKVLAHIVPTPSRWQRPGSSNRYGQDDSSPNNEVFCCLTAFTASGVEVQEGFISVEFLRMNWEGGGNHRSNRNLSFFTPASDYYHHQLWQTSSCSSRASSASNGDHDRDQTDSKRSDPSAGGSTQLASRSLSTSPSSPFNLNSVRSSCSSVDELIQTEEFNDNSSYDYGARIGYLCSSAAWFSTSNSLRKSADHLERNSNSCDPNTSTGTINPTHLHRPPHEPNGSLGAVDRGRADELEANMEARNSSRGSFFWKQAVGEWKIMYVCNSMDL